MAGVIDYWYSILQTEQVARQTTHWTDSFQDCDLMIGSASSGFSHLVAAISCLTNARTYLLL
jgi:hypothetical protein